MEVSDLKYIVEKLETLLNDEKVKEWLEHKCYFKRTTLDKESGLNTEFREGRRSVYLDIIQLIEAKKKGTICQKKQ